MRCLSLLLLWCFLRSPFHFGTLELATIHRPVHKLLSPEHATKARQQRGPILVWGHAFSRVAVRLRKNIVGSMRSSLQTCLLVLRAARARNTIASSLINEGSSRKAEVPLILINLGLCFIGSPIRLSTGPPL